MPPMIMNHDVDPKEAILESLGDIKDIEIFHNQVLVVVYIRPGKTKSGIHLPETVKDEDKFQGKVGLVVKMGNDAFNDPTGKWFKGVTIELLDWVVFRPSDGWAVTINGKLCRIIDDTDIRGRIPQPDVVW